MNKEEINKLFEKYKVRIPKEKQGQSECKICKENHKFSLNWTCFLYEYEEHYYCYEHIVNILLQQENKQLKEKIKQLESTLNEVREWKNKNGNRYIYQDSLGEDWYFEDLDMFGELRDLLERGKDEQRRDI